MTLTLLSALLLGAFSGAPSEAPATDRVQEASRFQGTWVFNRQESDDPMKAMAQARGGMRVRPSQGREMTEPEMQKAMEVIQAEMVVVEILILGVQDEWITMNTRDGGIFMVPGGGGEMRAVIGGVPYMVEAVVKDDRIAIRREWERMLFRDEFKVEDDGKRLVLKRTFRGGPVPEFVVKFVFDRQG